MDENVMRVLQMLQDGKISAQEAETLIAALRGESTSPSSAKPKEEEKKEEKSFMGGFYFGEKIKAPKIDLDFDNLGERISKAVSKIQPEKIVKKVQTQIRTATRTGAHWSATMSARVRTWTDGEDSRPVNPGGMQEQNDRTEQEFHLDTGASVLIENPLGNVTLTGISEGPASVVVQKVIWALRAEELKATVDQVDVSIHGTDSKLDIKVTAPDAFREGTVDLEVRVPRSALPRISTRYGHIEVAEIEGRVESVTTSGDLHLHDLGGDARGETLSGNLSLLRIGGTATVATQSGDITAEDVRRGLSANAASGDVCAVGIEGGRVECKSVSGDVSVERVGAQAPLDIVAESVSGDTSLKTASGNIALKAVSGDVNGEDLSATRVQAQTVSGDVQLRLREVFSGTMQVNTVSGDVNLELPNGSNVRISLGTTSGDLSCDHAANDVVSTDTLWTGQIGTGAGTLSVQTISGDVHIQQGLV